MVYDTAFLGVDPFLSTDIDNLVTTAVNIDRRAFDVPWSCHGDGQNG